MEVDELKRRMVARVDELAGALVEASHEIHAHPETNFTEVFAHGLLTDLLEREGIEVTRSAYDLETAFEARVGSEGPDISICCEYDALPGVGHACGHNIIATAGLGAGLAAAALAEEAGGRVRILGTPGEEGGAGKVFLLQRGAFDGVDAAMMVHPADADLLAMDVIAATTVRVTYEGEAAHAAAFPWQGRNALDAAVLGYLNVAALRQHIRPDERVHGVITKGGARPNIVPDATEALWMVRAATARNLSPLRDRVLAALEGGAAASGCSMAHEADHLDYADMVDNPALLALFAANSQAVGRPLADPAASPTRVMGSTDMGNVSYAVPSIHPMLKVAPAGVSIHSHEFARHARSDAGDRAVIDGAKALAMTVADLWATPGAMDDVRATFAPPPIG